MSSRCPCCDSVAANFEHHGEVIGQFLFGEVQSRRVVGVLEPQQRHAAFPGVAVGEVAGTGSPGSLLTAAIATIYTWSVMRTEERATAGSS